MYSFHMDQKKTSCQEKAANHSLGFRLLVKTKDILTTPQSKLKTKIPGELMSGDVYCAEVHVTAHRVTRH